MSQTKKVYYHLDLSKNSFIRAGFEVVNTLPNADLFLGRKVILAGDGLDYTYGLTGWDKTSSFDITTQKIISSMSGYFSGPVSINVNIGKQMFRQATTFPSGIPGSRFTLETAPTSLTAFDVVHTPDGGADVSVGTINFPSGALVGSITFATTLIVATNGMIKIVAPTDTFGMEGFYFDLKGHSLLPVYA